MNVLLLTPRPQVLASTILDSNDTYEVSMGTPDLWPTDIDFIVSYGYRHIIKEPYLSKYEDRMINIHMSMLPWNRGADPNFWSWFDQTPKGVSVHLINKGIDTGDIIMQMEIAKWMHGETLRSSYEFLNICVGRLFALEWARFRLGDWYISETRTAGTYHKSSDKDELMKKLPLGWDTPTDDVMRLGEARHEH